MPVGNNIEFESTINVVALTEHFYPTLYLQKVSLDSEPQDFTSMSFPTIIDYDLVFGDNFFYLLNSESAEYSFTDTTTSAYTYYTISLYTNSYGFTDMRKPEFEIQVTSQQTSS